MQLRNARVSSQSKSLVGGNPEVVMHTIRTAALAAVLVMVSASSIAQEKKEAPPAAAKPPATQAPPAAAAQPAPPAEQRGVVKDDEFIPTQDIPPDEGVTFPVGI